MDIFVIINIINFAKIQHFTSQVKNVLNNEQTFRCYINQDDKEHYLVERTKGNENTKSMKSFKSRFNYMSHDPNKKFVVNNVLEAARIIIRSNKK